MGETDILSLDGQVKEKMELPEIFDSEIRPDLIRRAVIAENSAKLQPQGHYPLAGMQTTARYYGKMHAYRSGRHMGIAIRPRQKLGGGIQGQVRRIPSSVKGKRAHPHLVEKVLKENINKREYQKAIASAISATKLQRNGAKTPIVVTSEIESISKTKDMLKVFKDLKLYNSIRDSKAKPRIRKGLRRSSRIKHYKRSVLLVVSTEGSAIKAARNMAGTEACTVSRITANLLAPGGVPGRITIWSEQAIKNVAEAVRSQKLG